MSALTLQVSGRTFSVPPSIAQIIEDKGVKPTKAFRLQLKFLQDEGGVAAADENRFIGLGIAAYDGNDTDNAILEKLIEMFRECQNREGSPSLTGRVWKWLKENIFDPLVRCFQSVFCCCCENSETNLDDSRHARTINFFSDDEDTTSDDEDYFHEG
jgi:hypothetical protein